MRLIPYLHSLHISDTTGDMAEPALPAKLLIKITVEYFEIFDFISQIRCKLSLELAEQMD